MDDISEINEFFDDNDMLPPKILLNGATDVGTLLLRYFLSAAITDSNGVLNISRKALSEIAEQSKANSSFEIWASTDLSQVGLDLTINWIK